MPKFDVKSQHDYEEGVHSFEHQKNKVSMTVPDMAYDIQTLLSNFTVMPAIQRPAIYMDDANFDNVTQLTGDLTDIDVARLTIEEFEKQKAVVVPPAETTTN